MSKLGKEGHRWHFLNLKMRKRTKVQIVVFFFLKKRPKRGKGVRELTGGEIFWF